MDKCREWGSIGHSFRRYDGPTLPARCKCGVFAPPPALAGFGAALRDEAIERVEEHADEEWLEEAYRVFVEMAQSRPSFTAEDVAIELKRQRPDLWTHEARAMGAVVRRVRADGWIASTGRFGEAKLAHAHRGPKRVWQSRVFDSTCECRHTCDGPARCECDCHLEAQL